MEIYCLTFSFEKFRITITDQYFIADAYYASKSIINGLILQETIWLVELETMPLHITHAKKRLKKQNWEDLKYMAKSLSLKLYSIIATLWLKL